MPQPSTTKALAVAGTRLDLPELSDVERAAKDAVEHHKQYVGSIDCAELYSFIGTELLGVKTQLKTLQKQREKLLIPLQNIKREAQSGMNAVANLFNPAINYLETSERLLKRERERWEAIEERRIQEERRQAAIKQQDEQRRIAEEARKRAEDAAAEARELQRLADEATAAGRAGEARQLVREAEQVVETAEAQTEMEAEIAEITSQSAMSIQAEMPKTSGVSSKKKWVAEFVDFRALCAGVLSGEIPIAAVKAKLNGKIVPASSAEPRDVEAYVIARSWFNDEAQDKGDDFNYPGVRAFERRETAVTVG